ncbi:MAG TPA: mechanosensitive ion channel family protein [Tepidisphaeraceae bacterium]|nr:mechanosensitive ion channel family protein [Tepidisphaeraceae bacterium]
MSSLLMPVVLFVGLALPTAEAPPPAATQPAAVTVTVQAAAPAAAADDSLVDSLANTRMAQIFQGKQRLQLADFTDPAFWIDTVKDLVTAVVAFIPRLFATALFLGVFYLAYRAARRVALHSMDKASVDPSIRDMLATLIKWVAMGFGAVIACNQLGIPIVAMLTGVSIIGLAVGFAAQETLANFIAGVVIFLDKPFKVGDWIEVDGVFAQVQRITFRSTRMLNHAGEFVILPNTFMLTNRVNNHTTNPINRVVVQIGIAYKESIDDARATLLALAAGDGRIVRDPAPAVVVTACADSSVNLAFSFWIEDESIELKIKYEYLERAKKALDAAGIEIPFPHVQLFLEKTDAVEQLATGPRRSLAA